MVERFEEAEAEDMNPEKLAYILIGVSLIIQTFFFFYVCLILLNLIKEHWRGVSAIGQKP